MRSLARTLSASLLALHTLAIPPARAADTMPPEIAAIMKRLQTGTRPSPEDQQKLQAWAATMMPPGAPTPAPDDDLAPSGPVTLTASDRPGGEACPAPGRAVAPPVAIDKDAYLAMARDTARAYGTQVPQDGRTTLDAALSDRRNPVAGADLAVGLLVRGYGSAAAIAAARGALAAPSDPNTANTLGTILRGMQDYKRATIAFAYAAALSPGSATIASNRAWLAMSQGDAAAATPLFEKAAQLGPPNPAVLLGQALIEECAGHHAKALPLFRASLALQWSDMAAAGVQWAQKSIQKASGNAADIGSPDAYGGKTGETPSWPDPPLPGTAKEFAGTMKTQFETWPITRYAKGWTDSIAANLGTAQARRPRLSETVIDDTGTTITYGYERQMFIFDDIAAMIVAREAAKYDKFTQQTADAIERDGTMMHDTSPGEDKKSCGMARDRNTAVHGTYAAIAEGRWTDVRKAMADLYGFSRATLATIDDGDTAANASAILASRAELMAQGFTTDLQLWALETNAAWRFKDFQCAPPAVVARPVGRLKPYKIDPNACHTGELHMNFGILNLNADCAHMVLTFGQLLQGSLDYKFGKDWDHDTLTIWAGAGFGTNGSGTKGSVTAGAQSGAYATVGAGGSVIDAGISGQAGVTGGVSNASAMPGGSFGPGPPPPDIGSGQGGVTAGATVAARISLIDGPPNPTGRQTEAGDGEITTSSGITFGGNATGSTTSGRAMHVPP